MYSIFIFIYNNKHNMMPDFKIIFKMPANMCDIA